MTEYRGRKPANTEQHMVGRVPQSSYKEAAGRSLRSLVRRAGRKPVAQASAGPSWVLYEGDEYAYWATPANWPGGNLPGNVSDPHFAAPLAPASFEYLDGADAVYGTQPLAAGRYLFGWFVQPPYGAAPPLLTGMS